MLEKGTIDDPFSGNPNNDSLPKLPHYMSLLLNDPESQKVSHDPESLSKKTPQRKLNYSSKKTASLPDLSTGMSSDESDDDFNNLLLGPSHRPSTPSTFNFQKMYTSTPGPVKPGQRLFACQIIHINMM